MILRPAELEDVESLLDIETASFDSDALSRRSFRHHIRSEHSDIQVAQFSGEKLVIGYGLVLYHRGTRLARLYSLAVMPVARGQGVGLVLLKQLEEMAVSRNRLFMRLEVAKNNKNAIRLYEMQGYRAFGEYTDYYEDHSDAVRMQKRIKKRSVTGIQQVVPWYQQTTDFTCGSASLMMAMASLDKKIQCSQQLEIDIWREATTIFMTSGHGGSHPLGLALAARRRGFYAEAWINNSQVLFLDGVRSIDKKQIMTLVHEQFVKNCRDEKIKVCHRDITQEKIYAWLRGNSAVLMLISTYRLDGRKTPHWVVITGMDDNCMYVHDPDVDDKYQLPIDCQHVPISREDFDRMSVFGNQRLRAAIRLKQH